MIFFNISLRSYTFPPRRKSALMLRLPDHICPLKHGDVSEDEHSPEHRYEPSGECSNDQEYYSFRPFHYSHLASDSETFSPRPCITHEECTHHSADAQEGPGRVSYSAKIPGEGKKEKGIRIPVEEGVKECPEVAYPTVCPGKDPVSQITYPSEKDEQSAESEVCRNNKGSHESNGKSCEGENIGMDRNLFCERAEGLIEKMA